MGGNKKRGQCMGGSTMEGAQWRMQEDKIIE